MPPEILNALISFIVIVIGGAGVYIATTLRVSAQFRAKATELDLQTKQAELERERATNKTITYSLNRVGQLEEDIKEKDEKHEQELATLTDALKRANDKIEGATKDLTEAKKTIDELIAKQRTDDLKRVERDRELATLKVRITNLEEERNQLAESVRQKDIDLATRNGKIEALTHELKEVRKELEGVKARLATVESKPPDTSPLTPPPDITPPDKPNGEPPAVDPAA